MRTDKDIPTTAEVLADMKLRFTSGNSIPVERAMITATEFQVLLTEIQQGWKKIDALGRAG